MNTIAHDDPPIPKNQPLGRAEETEKVLGAARALRGVGVAIPQDAA